jgi:hypothetical protein
VQGRFQGSYRSTPAGQFPWAKITLFDGTGGNAGIDTFQGIYEDGQGAWQHKNFPNCIQDLHDCRVTCRLAEIE